MIMLVVMVTVVFRLSCIHHHHHHTSRVKSTAQVHNTLHTYIYVYTYNQYGHVEPRVHIIQL